MVDGPYGRKDNLYYPRKRKFKTNKRKNIIDFDGEPMISWTIKVAIKSNIFDRIIVSTDSKKIADIACSYGIEVPFLRDGLADDTTPISDVTISALNQANNYWNEDYGQLFN